MSAQCENLIIVGSGPAGLTAAIYASRAHLKPIVIEGTMPGGQLMGTSFVENWPGITSIMGPELMRNLREHAISFGAQIVPGNVVSVSTASTPFSVQTDHSETYTAHALILALGATPKRLGCPGEDEYWGKGVTTCAICDGFFYAGKKVIVVGGGDSAMESASFLTKFTDAITIVHVLDTLTASSAMQERVLKNKATSIIYNSTVTMIQGNGEHVTHAVLTNQKTKAETTVEVDGIFIAIGLTPNTEILKNKVELDKYGYIKITDGTKTSVEGIFAAGDVQDYRYRQAITSAGSGCMAALDAEQYLRNRISL
jgi:thioredoxin reductase (NADPH)